MMAGGGVGGSGAMPFAQLIEDVASEVITQYKTTFDMTHCNRQCSLKQRVAALECALIQERGRTQELTQQIYKLLDK